MSKPAPKILMVLNDKAWFWSHRLPLAMGIINERWDLTVATHEASTDKGLTDIGIKGIELAKIGRGFSPLAELQLFISIFKSIREQRPDLIHAITLRHAFYTGLAARLCQHKDIIFTLAGLGSLFSAQSFKAKIMRAFALPFFKLAFRHKGAKVIFQNPDDFETLKAIGAIDPSACTIIKGSGVDLDQFKQTPLPNDGDPVFLFSSRLIKDKGLDEFVTAAKIIKEKNKAVRFVVAGGIQSENPNSMKEKDLRRWHDDGIIEWLGHVDDMPAVIRSCHVFVLPSYYREGVPKVVLEALATGRPVITTDMPGCRETVEDGINGFKIPPRDAQILAKKIEEILSDPDRLKAMAQASRKKAEEEFDVKSVVERTLNIYKSYKALLH